MTKFKKVPLKEKIAVALVVAALITNPLTGQYIFTAIYWTFDHLFNYGSYVMLWTCGYLLALGAWHYHKLEAPKTTGKHKTQKYIETAVS